MAATMESMWSNKRFDYQQPNNFAPRASSYVDRAFQLKYSRRTMWLLIAASLLAYIPLTYFLNQNYGILTDLMYDQAPEVVQNLEREQIFMNIVVWSIFLAQVVFLAVFSKRMTTKIIGPIKKLRNHLRLLSRGEYAAPDLRVREDDEFLDLVATYNYFYSGLRDQTERDLHKLKQVAEQVPGAPYLYLLHDMIEEKALQLNRPEDLPHDRLSPLTSLESVKAADPRHAS